MAGKVTEVAIKLNRRNACRQKIPAVILMTDSKRLADPAPFIPHLPAGSLVIIRAFSEKEKENLIFKNIKLCKKHKVLLSVSDSLKLACKYRLEGLHIPEKRRHKYNKGLLFNRFLITTSCHSLPSLLASEQLNFGNVLLSPIFPTQSHPNGKSLGHLCAQNWIKNSEMNIYALGGISTKTASRLLTSCFSGIAGISFNMK